MEQKKYGICFGLPQEGSERGLPQESPERKLPPGSRLSELVDILHGANLPVRFWPSVHAFRRSPVTPERLDFQERVHLVVLDHSYQPGTKEKIVLPGDSFHLRVQLNEVRRSFPEVRRIVLVSNYPLYTVEALVNGEQLCDSVTHTSYGAVWNGGVEGIVTAFRAFLAD